MGLESDLQETADQRNLIISRRVLQLKDEKEEAEQNKEETKEDAETRDEATRELLSETIQTVFRLIGVDPMDLSAIERCDLAGKLKELGITLSGETLDIVVEDFNLAGLKESKDQSGNS